jgi:sn-glycerol 3-phosphate transport system permease protein
MVENRPLLTFLTHLIVVVGVAIVALPLYVAFVASTLTYDEVLQAPMPLIPGGEFVNNYLQVLTQGSERASAAPVGRMMWNSLVTALVIAIGKIAISLLSAFAIVYFRFRFRTFFFWMIS